MTSIRNLFIKNKATIAYGFCLAVLLFFLKWLEIRWIIFDHSFEIFIGCIAFLFTGLGIWLALILSRKHESPAKPSIETVVVEKIVYVNENQSISEVDERVRIDESGVSHIDLSKRELEILSLLAEGYSNQEIAEKLFVSLSTVKTHNQNLFEKLEVKRRTQAIVKAKRLNLIR